MVRPATPEDLPALTRMSLRFMQESHYRCLFEPDAGLAERLARLALEQGAVFVAVDAEGTVIGMLGGFVLPWMGIGPMAGSEVAWWIEPERRGGMDAVRLLRAFEAWCRARGAAMVQMIAPDARVAEFYERAGYVPLETAYVKRLSANDAEVDALRVRAVQTRRAMEAGV